MLRCLAAWFAAALLFALANAGHLANPGWFSHDELQWGWRAQQGLGHDWFDVDQFQYRPLTFELWLRIARLLFAHPAVWHALWVALGFGVCALLFAVSRRAGASPRIAAAGAAAFALNPYAAYVHGWAATLAELLWTASALGIAWFAFARPAREAGIAALGLTLAALLAKESALAILPLALLAWALSPGPRWRAVAAGAAVPTLAYLAVRLPTLLFGPRPGGAYGWSLENLPLRWAEFQAWPLATNALEMTSLALARPGRLALVATVAALLMAAVLRADRRLGLLLLAGGALALGPAIVLDTGYPQYGYAASALAWAVTAAAWTAMRRPARAIVVVALAANVVHGANVQREMLRVGRIEANFTPAVSALAATPGEPLRLSPAVASDDWIYRRLLVSLPADGRAVELQPAGGVRIEADGRLR